MLDAMTPWSDQSPSYKRDRLQSPDRAQRQDQAGPSYVLPPSTPAVKAPARFGHDSAQCARSTAQEATSVSAATPTYTTQPQASVSPPSEQHSDSTDADSTLADERQQPAEPLLQEDEQRFTMYPIE